MDSVHSVPSHDDTFIRVLTTAFCGFGSRKWDSAASGVFVNCRVPSSEAGGLPMPAPRATRWDGRRSVSGGEPGRAGGQGGRSCLAEGKNIPA